MATSGDILPAIREDFYMATDRASGCSEMGTPGCQSAAGPGTGLSERLKPLSGPTQTQVRGSIGAEPSLPLEKGRAGTMGHDRKGPGTRPCS